MRFATYLVDRKGWHYSRIFVIGGLFNSGTTVALDTRINWILTASWFECDFTQSFHLLFHSGHSSLVLLVHLYPSVTEVIYMLLEFVHETIHLGSVAITKVCDLSYGLLEVVSFIFVFLFSVKLAPFFYFWLWCCIQVWHWDHQFVHVGIQLWFKALNIKFLWLA